MDYIVEPVVNPKLRWGVGAKKAGDIGIGVGQTPDKSDRVYLQVGYTIEDAYKDRIRLLPDDERTEFIWDIRFQLLSLDCPFDHVEEPLEYVNFSDFMFVEVLTRQRLSESIFRIHRGYAGFSWMLQRKFPDVKLDKEAPPPAKFWIN